MWQAGRFPFDRLLKFYRFRDINKAMADLRRGVTVKPVLQIGPVKRPPRVARRR
jgi:aryl-alcohol dehydrogenase